MKIQFKLIGDAVKLSEQDYKKISSELSQLGQSVYQDLTKGKKLKGWKIQDNRYEDGSLDGDSLTSEFTYSATFVYPFKEVMVPMSIYMEGREILSGLDIEEDTNSQEFSQRELELDIFSITLDGGYDDEVHKGDAKDEVKIIDNYFSN